MGEGTINLFFPTANRPAESSDALDLEIYNKGAPTPSPANPQGTSIPVAGSVQGGDAYYVGDTVPYVATGTLNVYDGKKGAVDVTVGVGMTEGADVIHSKRVFLARYTRPF